ncbi:bifunctional diguanylate cyclase/phosphodiesterase [Gordonibacter sp.]|uniref:bifunctional diguanylate cyclase/phosphodiesterase n=1 Tax=Gordonibacter sp. TaxID=1968902 RepID=UPI002FC9AE0D
MRDDDGVSSEEIKKRSAKKGLTFKLLIFVPFCIALVLQVALCVVALTRSGTFGQMEADAYDLFSARVSNRAVYLENDMISRWSDIDALIQGVGGHVNEALSAKGATAADIESGSPVAVSIVDESADDLLAFVRRAEVDGVFLVLANGSDGPQDGGETVHTALYVRDSNPKADVENGSDLQLAACPISVGKDLGIALDSQWSAAFPLEAEGEAQSDFYYRPLRAAQEYPRAKISDLGYWGKPTDLGWAGTQSITYSKPLRDAAGNVVGVLGVEIRLDRIATYLPYIDLNESGNGSYLLAVTGEDGGYARDGGVSPFTGQRRAYEVLATTGASQSLYVENGSLEATLDNKGRMMADAPAGSALDTQAVAGAKELKLYDGTSPFASEHWALVGLERESELFSASYALSSNLWKVLILSIVIGVVIALFTSWTSSSRLRNLMREVRAARPEQPISFTPTNIVEIDELSESIESLGSEVASAASRLSQILKLSDRSIAAFECNEETGVASYTDGFFDTLGVVCRFAVMEEGEAGSPDGAEGGGSMPLAAFKRLFRSLEHRFEEEAEGRWIVSDGEGRRWVRLVSVRVDGLRRTFGLIEDVTDEIATRRRIEHERDHDVLTGLLNRRAFEQSVSERLSVRPPAFGAMLMLDLDNLKYINDTYGHDWGDYYIKAAAGVINASFRGEAVYARISGDEFLVFADCCEKESDAQRLFDRFMHALDTSALEAPDGTVLKVRASAGIAFYPEDATDFVHLREYADFAMYEAKNSRKGALMRFDRESHERGAFILSNKEDLNRLLDEGLVDYHFQPIVDARGGETIAYEALMRPRLASISTPDRVLLLARSQSKLYQVEHMTFFGALEAFAPFASTDNAALFVNSIATQRLSSDDEEELGRRFGPLLRRMVVEITENDYSREMSLYKERVVRRWGARLAIDDFGSGYNGETSLLDYRADFVKLDMGIVRAIDRVKDHQDIARNLISFSHDRGIRVVAEGVETEDELRALVRLEVDYIQGYLVGRPAARPLPASDEAKRLIRSLAEEL